MFIPSKILWRTGPLSKNLPSTVHVRESGKLLYQQIQQQLRNSSTIRSRGRRIYIAGAHHLQTVIANALAQSADPIQNPITLMVPLNSYLRHYVDTNGKLQIIKDGIASTMVGAVDMEVLPFPMKSTVPENTYAPSQSLKFKRLLLNRPSDEEVLSVEDLSLLFNDDPICGVKTKGTKMARLPISDIKVYDLSFFIELNKSLCDRIQANLDGVEERVAEIRVPPTESDIDTVPANELSPINCEPIDHLIYGERPRDLIYFFRHIKHRLYPSSTVMVIGNHPGLVENLYEQLFPDVSKRPNFVECTNAISVGEETSIEGFWNSHRSVPLLRAQISVGPLTRTLDDCQTPGQLEKRQNEIKYLESRLLNAPTLNADKIDRRTLERYKLKKLVARSVIYPLTVAYNCMMGEIFSTEERVQDAKLLFEEACAVVQAIDPNLTHQTLLTNILWQVVRAPNAHPLMWRCVNAGHDTNIDLDNGWIIKYGKGMTPTHEKYARLVKEKASESARTIAAMQEESARAEARLRMAKEIANKKLRMLQAKRLEGKDAEDVVRKGFKRFVFGEKIEAPLNVPDKTYFKSRSPTGASSTLQKLEVPRNDKMEKLDEIDP